MTRFIPLIFVAFALSACASVMGAATQEVAFETPGANDAVCYVDNGETKYRVNPPQKVTISKRSADLTVRCLADGNREKTVIIDPKHEATTLANAFNGFIPGVWVDYETGALFAYPALITVDFTNIKAVPMERPAYDKHLDENPDLFGMEEFRPGRSALIKDKYEQEYHIQKRDMFKNPVEGSVISAPLSSVDSDSAAGSTAEGGESVADKYVESIGAAPPVATAPVSPAPQAGTYKDGSAGDLTRRMNPGIFDAGGNPVAIYPQETP